MTITYKTAPDGSKFMDIIELKNLDASHENFKINRGDNVAQSIFYHDLMAFIDFCITYASDVFKGKEYTFEQVIPNLFVTKIKSEGQYKSYVRYALYAGLLYAEKLKKLIRIDDIDNLDELTYTLSADYEWLIAEFEYYHKGQKGFHVRHGSRPSLNVMDIKWGANQLMFAELTGSLRYFDYRNTKPYVMFMVRQCLELLGKNIIGYESVDDSKGNPIHQFTQVSWTFLHDMEKQGKLLVTIPIKASAIHQLNSWSNSFVHSSYIYNCYIQFYALEILYDFSAPAKNPVQTFNGYHQSTLYGDFRIPDLALLRQEFETYVKKLHNGYPLTVKWLSPENIGAYVLNLGPLPSEGKRCCISSIISSLLHFKR